MSEDLGIQQGGVAVEHEARAWAAMASKSDGGLDE
jgi:hypothetical protein